MARDQDKVRTQGMHPDFAVQQLPVVEVVIAALVLDESPRLKGVDESHVHALQEAESTLPPILVHSETMRVIDGIHRVRAATAQGAQAIAARLFEGSQEEAYVLAVKMNTEHGLPLSLAERRVAALHVASLYPDWSDRAIAGVVGLSAKTIAKIRRSGPVKGFQPDRRIGKDGRVRPLRINVGRTLATQVMAARPDASLREIAKAAGISPNTARDVRNRLRNGEDPVPARKGAEPKSDAYPMTVNTADAGVVKEAVSQLPIREGNFSWAQLSRDPSLRSTEAGRFLLRSLRVQELDADTWNKVVNSVPKHRTQGVADLARQCAAAWEALANRLEASRG